MIEKGGTFLQTERTFPNSFFWICFLINFIVICLQKKNRKRAKWRNDYLLKGKISISDSSDDEKIASRIRKREAADEKSVCSPLIQIQLEANVFITLTLYF